MTYHCVECRAAAPDLTHPSQFRMSLLVCGGLRELGGSVEIQRDLYGLLWDQHRVAHKTTQRYVDGLAARGFLRVEYHGHWPPKKRILLVQFPERGQVRATAPHGGFFDVDREAGLSRRRVHPSE